MGTVCPCRKSPEARTKLPVSGWGEMDELHQHEAPTLFTSHLYFQLEPAQAVDIIPGCCPAGINVSTRRNMGETQWGVHSEGASHTRHKQCQQPTGDPESDPLEGSIAEKGSRDNAGGLLGPPAPGQ